MPQELILLGFGNALISGDLALVQQEGRVARTSNLPRCPTIHPSFCPSLHPSLIHPSIPPSLESCCHIQPGLSSANFWGYLLHLGLLWHCHCSAHATFPPLGWIPIQNVAVMSKEPLGTIIFQSHQISDLGKQSPMISARGRKRAGNESWNPVWDPFQGSRSITPRVAVPGDTHSPGISLPAPSAEPRALRDVHSPKSGEQQRELRSLPAIFETLTPKENRQAITSCSLSSHFPSGGKRLLLIPGRGM